MAIKLKVKVTGLKQLDKALGQLPKSTGKNVLRVALRKGGAPIERAAERKAPKRSGQLEASIATSTKLSRRQSREHRKKTKSTVEVFVGAGALPQAITQEFGARHHAAQPFMRPAWDENKMKSLGIIRREIKTGIDKATKRLERKAAREAAKIKAGK